MTTINFFSLEDLQVKLNELHDCMYTLLYYEDDFTQEQIEKIKKDFPVSDIYPTKDIPQGQIFIIQNKDFNPVVSMEFKAEDYGLTNTVQAYFEEANKRLSIKYPPYTDFFGKKKYELFNDLCEVMDNIPDEYWEDRFKEWSDKLPPMPEEK